MVALSPETPEIASQDNDLRGRIGAGLAVVWVLTQLWAASPLPYMLKRTSDIDWIVTDTQARALALGFVLCLAFVLFRPRYMKLPWPVDAILAVVGGVSGSVAFWSYDVATALPGSQSELYMGLAFVGLVTLTIASGRVFGWLAAIVVAVLAFLGPLLNVLGLVKPQGVSELLALHWYTTESVFGISLGLTVSFGFLFFMLGSGLDVLGMGRPIARYVLRPLPQDAFTQQQAHEHPFARRIWALALLFFVFSAVNIYEPLDIYSLESVAVIALYLVQYFAVYAVCLGFAWACSWMSPSRWRQLGMSIAIGGMLLGTAMGLDLALRLIVHGGFHELSAMVQVWRRVAGPWLWIVLLGALSLPLAALAARAVDSGRRQRWTACLATLPFVLLFWDMAVVGLSPGLSAFYAVVLMLLVMAELCLVEMHRAKRRLADAPRVFAESFFVPLCYGTARVALRAAILAAAYGMIFPWAWALVLLGEPG